MVRLMSKLSPRQERFVAEYLVDLSAKEAAIRAGYSAKTADKKGSGLLRHPGVAAAISARKHEIMERAGVDARWLLQRLAAEADADLADIFDKNGDLLPVEEWPPIWRRGLVAGIEIHVTDDGEVTVKKIKLSDRVKRLEMIGRHVGVQAFKEVVEHKGLDGLAERLERAKARLEAADLVIEAEPRPLVPQTPAAPAQPAAYTPPAPIRRRA